MTTGIFFFFRRGRTPPHLLVAKTEHAAADLLQTFPGSDFEEKRVRHKIGSGGSRELRLLSPEAILRLLRRIPVAAWRGLFQLTFTDFVVPAARMTAAVLSHLVGGGTLKALFIAAGFEPVCATWN